MTAALFMGTVESFSQEEAPVIIQNIFASRHPQDPGEPAFFLLPGKKNAQLGIGGYVRLIGIYDLNGLQNLKDFITYQIPVGSENTSQDRFQLDAGQSRIFTEFRARTRRYGPLKIYIEADFYGSNNNLRLRHAYGSFAGFLVGQTWSTFMDLEASPNTIDFEGPNSEIALRSPMVRYSGKIGPAFRFAIAAETPETSITNTLSTKNIPQFMPDFTGRASVYGKPGHLQLAGVYRDIAYEDTSSGTTRTAAGWGLALSGRLHISKNDVFMFQGTYGKGIARYIQDISGAGLDLVPENMNATALEALPVWGAYGAWEHNWTTAISNTLIYGFTQADDLGNKPATSYALGQYVAANVFWKILPMVTTAIEYLWGQRVNKNGRKGAANRINFMVQFDL